MLRHTSMFVYVFGCYHICHINDLRCNKSYVMLCYVTLYTTLPHNIIKEKLTELIKHIFNREGSLYLARDDKNMPFLLLNNQNDINCGHVRRCVMLSIIFWTTFL